MSELQQLKWDNDRLRERLDFNETRAMEAEDLLMIVHNIFYGDGLDLNLKHSKLTGDQIRDKLRKYLVEYCY